VRTNKEVNPRGLTEREDMILSLHDHGARPREIASMLKLATRYVEQIIQRYTSDDRVLREAAIRRASQQLGAKCAALRARMAS
jgi:DNA-binding NarL/FixJ family response regulator